MTTKELSKTLLSKRSESNIFPTGMIIESIGPEGLEEALRRRWVTADSNTGYLTLSGNLSINEEMRNAAKSEDSSPIVEQQASDHGLGLGEKNFAYHDVLQEHLTRNRSITEIAAPATGKPAPSAAPATQPTQASAPTSSLRAGDDASVIENGKNYVGRVSQVTGDDYRLSFQGERPTRDTFKGNELQRV